MWYRGLIVAGLLCALGARAGPILLTTKDGQEFYGSVIREQGGTILLKWRKGLVRVEARDVVDRVPDIKLSAVIAARANALKPGDTEGQVRLSLLCIESGRLEVAKALLDKAQRGLDARLRDQASSNEKAGKKAAKSAQSTGRTKAEGGPWRPPAGASFRIEVVKKIMGEQSEDRVRWSRISRLFLSAKPAFSVLPFGSDGDADFVMKIGAEARILGENKFFGSVPISYKWSGRVRLTIVDSGGSRRLLRMDVPEVTEEASVNIDGGELVLNKAFDRFIAELRRCPAFRSRFSP